MNARDSILNALHKASQPSASPRSFAYNHNGKLNQQARIQLFTERVAEYGASVHHVTPERLSATLRSLILNGRFRSVAVPDGLPLSWSSDLQDLTLIYDGTADNADLAVIEAVLTGSTAAVAVSGSIILQHGPAEGRRVLTLLPDHHFCVVAVDTVFETLPEALEALEPTRPTTIISGPSATADIEMTRIQGVHGPRQLTVLLLLESAREAGDGMSNYSCWRSCTCEPVNEPP